jgi:sec-independent protein translocase protein TatA
MNPGLPELLIVLVIVLLVFGVGRVSRIGGELGSAVSNFRRGLNDGVNENKDVNKTSTTTPTNSDV